MRKALDITVFLACATLVACGYTFAKTEDLSKPTVVATCWGEDGKPWSVEAKSAQFEIGDLLVIEEPKDAPGVTVTIRPGASRCMIVTSPTKLQPPQAPPVPQPRPAPSDAGPGDDAGTKKK